MIIAVVLNGWSSSVRKRDTRTATLVKEVLDGRPHELLTLKSMFIYSRAKRIRRFVLANQHEDYTLLCVGKSFGARNMVQRVLNDLPPLMYKRSVLMTIDPCWPIRGDWTPNLNDQTLVLRHRMNKAVNFYVKGPPELQCGARLEYIYGCVSGWVENVAVRYPEADHYSIVENLDVVGTLLELVEYLEE